MGQPAPKRDECMKKFFAYARSQGMKTVSLARISDSITMYDSFHFRENSASRKKLAEHIGHQMRVLIAEHIASKVPVTRFEEIYSRHAYSDFVSQVAGDEQRARLAAFRGMPSASDPEQSSVMQRDEVLARAPFPAELMAPMPVANMFVGDSRDLRVGFTRQDDQDLDDILGTDVDFFNSLRRRPPRVRTSRHAGHAKKKPRASPEDGLCRDSPRQHPSERAALRRPMCTRFSLSSGRTTNRGF